MPKIATTAMSASAAPPQDTLRSLAKAVLDETGSYDAAVPALLAALKTRPLLEAEFLRPHMTARARDLLSSVAASERQIVWHRPVDPMVRVRALSDGMRLTLLDFRLPNGMRLAEATRVTVEDAAGDYAKQAGDMAWKARWLSAIARAMPEGVPVADVMDAAALAALQEQTK